MRKKCHKKIYKLMTLYHQAEIQTYDGKWSLLIDVNGILHITIEKNGTTMKYKFKGIKG